MPQSSAGALSAGQAIRRMILDSAYNAKVGHIGSCLSIADIVDVLVSTVMRGVGSDDPARDLLVLSKGHGALALYSALHLAGHLDVDPRWAYCAEGTTLGVHPEHTVPGIDFSTGSLGQGLSMATGAAFAGLLAGSDRRVFALISDAELNEGATWEAIMLAGHHRLSRLIMILDDNGQQALAPTRDVIDLGRIGDKVAAFGWHVVDVDGHDRAGLTRALNATSQGPLMIRARTVAGSGVSFMEGQVAWHYLPMTAEQYRSALIELEHLVRPAS